MFLPWLRSGAADRNAFAAARAARALGLLEGLGDLAAAFVSVIPVFLALCVVASALNRRRVGSTLAAVVGAGVVAAAVLLLRSPVSSGIGPKAGVVLGGAAVIAGVTSVTRGQR